MENKNVLTISDLTTAILNGKMTIENATNMFEKQLNASIEAAENAKKVREENIDKSAAKAIKAIFDFLIASHPELIPNDFILTDEMINEAVNDLKIFTEEIIDALPATVKCTNKSPLSPEVDNLDELLDTLAKIGLFKVKPTCEHENLKKEDNISKFLREIGL